MTNCENCNKAVACSMTEPRAVYLGSIRMLCDSCFAAFKAKPKAFVMKQAVPA